jgi:hypothetical protein
VAEVLEDGTQGLQPLDPQNHVGGAEREPVKVDVEVFAVDHDVHGMTTARVTESVAVRHSDA